MYVPKQWLFLFGIGFTFGLAMLWLYAQNAFLGQHVESLENDVVALEHEVAALRSSASESDQPPASRPEATNARLLVPVTADGTPVGDTLLLDVATSADLGVLAMASTPRAATPSAEQGEVICTFLTEDGAAHSAAQGGDGGSGTNGSEVTVEDTNEIGNYATNSGNILDSFFLDGGQGDIGININESVLTGVNFNIVHQSGTNSSLSESGNTHSEAVSGNSPTNTHTPSFSDLEISAPVAVTGTIGASNAERGDGSSAAGSAPGSDQPGDEPSIAIVSPIGAPAAAAPSTASPDTTPPSSTPAATTTDAPTPTPATPPIEEGADTPAPPAAPSGAPGTPPSATAPSNTAPSNSAPAATTADAPNSPPTTETTNPPTGQGPDTPAPSE